MAKKNKRPFYFNKYIFKMSTSPELLCMQPKMSTSQEHFRVHAPRCQLLKSCLHALQDVNFLRVHSRCQLLECMFVYAPIQHPCKLKFVTVNTKFVSFSYHTFESI